MAYAFQDEIMGLTPIAQVDAARRSPQYPGYIAHAVDPVQGGAEFIYLQGAANTVKGSLVTYNSLTGATVLAATGAKGGSPMAVAMAAIGAGQWGWYQITGNALVAKVSGTALTLGAAVGVSATAGQVTTSAGGAATAGALTGAVIDVAALATDATVNVAISRPTVN
jgi:predicted RecA/RadA family phage recombinase